jgi:hypothetical protein
MWKANTITVHSLIFADTACNRCQQSKKDVSITYTPILPKTDPLAFDDLVQYRSLKAAVTSAPSTVEGVDTLSAHQQPATSAGGAPPAQFKWRGKGWLKLITSKWQVLGHGDGWAVTFFEKTLFTPAGLDVYSRDDKGLPGELFEEIVRKATEVGGEIGKLAEGLFEVQRSHRS